MTVMKDAVSISEAKRQLSKLIARVERGEEVAIRRGPKVVAKIVALEPAGQTGRCVFGALSGQIWLADDLDELGPEWSEHI